MNNILYNKIKAMLTVLFSSQAVGGDLSGKFPSPTVSALDSLRSGSAGQALLAVGDGSLEVGDIVSGGSYAVKTVGTDGDYADLPAAMTNTDGDRVFYVISDQTLAADLLVPSSWDTCAVYQAPGVSVAVGIYHIGPASGGSLEFLWRGANKSATITRGDLGSGSSASFVTAGDYSSFRLENLTLSSTSTTNDTLWLEDDGSIPVIVLKNLTVELGNHRKGFFNYGGGGTDNYLELSNIELYGGGTSCYEALYIQSEDAYGKLEDIRVFGSWKSGAFYALRLELLADPTGLIIRNISAFVADNFNTWIESNDASGIMLYADSQCDCLLVGRFQNVRINTGDGSVVSIGDGLEETTVKSLTAWYSTLVFPSSSEGNARIVVEDGYLGNIPTGTENVDLVRCSLTGSITGNNITMDMCFWSSDAMVTLTGSQLVVTNSRAGVGSSSPSSSGFTIHSSSVDCALIGNISAVGSTNNGDSSNKVDNDRTFS